LLAGPELQNSDSLVRGQEANNKTSLKVCCLAKEKEQNEKEVKKLVVE